MKLKKKRQFIVITPWNPSNSRLLWLVYADGHSLRHHSTVNVIWYRGLRDFNTWNFILSFLSFFFLEEISFLKVKNKEKMRKKSWAISRRELFDTIDLMSGVCIYKILCNAWNMKLIWIAKHKNEMWDSCCVFFARTRFIFTCFMMTSTFACFVSFSFRRMVIISIGFWIFCGSFGFGAATFLDFRRLLNHHQWR